MTIPANIHRPSARDLCRSGAQSGDTCHVGFNPHRQQHRSPFDYVMVAAAFAVVIALVIWAFIG